MKKIIFVLAIISNCYLSEAQGIIAIEHLSGGTTFTKHLDSAILVAQSGDFIYLPGGSYNLGTPINKGVNIIGVGHYPDSTVATNQTIISGDISIVEGADNLYLEGLYVMGNVSLLHLDYADNVVIKRCNVNQITTNGSHFSQFENDSTMSENWQIYHNVVRSDINFANIKSFTLHGNIIAGVMYYAFSGGIMENNIFLFSSQTVHSFEEIRNCTVKNNIFLNTWELSYPGYACNNPPCGSFNNIFLNNSFCMGGQNIYLENGMTAVSLNNKFDALSTDIFVNQTGNTFNYAHNYQLQSGFNASILGNDGLELGIYGSSDVYKASAVPMNPHISTKNIAPSTSSNGLLNVDIKVIAQ